MTNWTKMMKKDLDSVKAFANGKLSRSNFEKAFSGKSNPARCLVRKHGVQVSRKLAEKALKRRGLV